MCVGQGQGTLKLTSGPVWGETSDATKTGLLWQYSSNRGKVTVKLTVSKTKRAATNHSQVMVQVVLTKKEAVDVGRWWSYVGFVVRDSRRRRLEDNWQSRFTGKSKRYHWGGVGRISWSLMSSRIRSTGGDIESRRPKRGRKRTKELGFQCRNFSMGSCRELKEGRDCGGELVVLKGWKARTRTGTETGN